MEITCVVVISVLQKTFICNNSRHVVLVKGRIYYLVHILSVSMIAFDLGV